MDLLWYVVMVVKWDDECAEKIIMIAWAMWTNRNEVRNRGDRKLGQALVDYTIDYLRKYQAYCEKPALVQSKEPLKWCLPQHGRYKITVDGVVFDAQKVVGLGVLIRDTEGKVVGACSKKIMAPLGAVL